jgi:putative heme-binding domain-containing protein
MCVYEGTLLPKKYWGQPLHTDAGPRHVRCYHLKANGAGYDVDREDMVTSTDNWFRPSDVCVAPDGSVMVADWYDPGVGGHGMGDITRGRIYRLAPTGNKYQVPKVELQTKEGIIAALSAPSLSVRYMAMAKLQDMEVTDAANVVYTLLRDRQAPSWARARALWQLAAIGSRAPHGEGQLGFAGVLIGTVAENKDPRCRTLVLRALKDTYGMTPADLQRELLQAKKAIESDPSAYLRGVALLLLRDTDAHTAKRLIFELAKQYDGKDRFYLEAIGIAVGHHDKARRNAILADFDKEFPEWNDKVADLVWELQPPSVLASLGKRLADPRLPAEQRGRIVDILAASEDPGAGKSLLAALCADVPAEVVSRVLENFEKQLPGKWTLLRQSPELASAIRSLLDSSSGRSAGLTLAAAAGRVEALAQVRALATDDKQPAELRRQAVRTLGKLPAAQAVEALTPFVNPPGPFTADALEALGLLAKTKNPAFDGALKTLQHIVNDKAAKLETRVGALSALAGSRPGSAWMLALHEKGQLDPSLKSDVARLLRNSPYPDLRNKALVAFPPPGRLDLKKLPSITVLAARKGDAARGGQLLVASLKNDLQCLKCHSVRGVGGQVGPDLSMIGKKASKENLFESILYPSKAVADQFINWQIETNKGLSLSGLLVEETADSVTLRDGNGKDTKIAKKDIESRTKGAKSLMPEDLLVYMTEDDLVDLVACLFELKTPALTVDSWHIAGPFDNGEGDTGLDEVYPPEKEVDLKGVYRGKLGRVQWRTVRPDAGGYVDLAAHFAGQSDNIVSYLYQEIESPADQEATLLLGADDGCKLWVNGQLVHSDRQHRAAAPAQDTVGLRLRKGVNRVLLKICNGGGPHGFYFTLLAEQELKRVVSRQ